MKFALQIILFITLTLAANPCQAIYFKNDINKYQNYLDKINAADSKKSTNLYEIKLTKDLEYWLEEAELRLEKQISQKANSRLSLSISKNGFIEKVDILNFKNPEMELFKKLSAEILNTKLPKLPETILEANKIDLLKVILDTNLIYLERPATNYLDTADHFALKTIKDNNLDFLHKIEEAKSLEVRLIDPKFLEYAKIGEILSLKPVEYDSLILSGNISAIKNRSFIVDVFQIQTAERILPVRLQYIYKMHNSNQDRLGTLINAGLNTALQGGIINAISSYGILPSSLAIIGISGKALQLIEKQMPINFSNNEIISLKKIGGENK